MNEIKRRKCPICSESMMTGYIYSGKNSIVWTPANMKHSIFNNSVDENEIQLAKLNYLKGCYVKVFRCQNCKMMLIDENDLEIK